MEVSLKYKDDEDKTYGVAGMAVGMVIFDGEDLLSQIAIDNEPHNVIEFTGEFYFSGNPHLSPKRAWNQILQHYNLSMAMLIANVMCRSIVMKKKSVTVDIKKAIHKIIEEEGRNSCSLENDEIDNLFEKNYNYLYRIFSHHGVQSIISDFVDTLKSKRTLSRNEVLDELKSLSMI